ncbi:putative toxin-antitoxin system, toxin component, PemK family [Campylobacter pinnipediorum subsp. caledonicus]|uniref:Putative toxin-antitoxin system, toxin component, PemK family n=1 Tax=Campylobacter pinnipediorum subsp. caledonicus TaxID=1874362 RepID=A0A1S6U5P1_9BACT|nr:type II toxin-antitoxin system PemK/MazF family toxin [Campylobacter pinnipediorum]AQW87088.1 putative toxin-antitoxin system, toxin component, PemK family [Campylobacter pinnipediorum subsp. caledonicus]
MTVTNFRKKYGFSREELSSVIGLSDSFLEKIGSQDISKLSTKTTVLFNLLEENIKLKNKIKELEAKEKDINDSFDSWNEVKKEVNKREGGYTVKPKNIYWVNLGLNVGDEEFGKGKKFLRPVLAIKQVTKNLFIGMPLTTTIREDNELFHTITYTNNKQEKSSSVIIFQIKAFSIKRIVNRAGKIDNESFKIITDKLIKIVTPR